MTDQEVIIVHAIPGRVRFKVANLRGNPSFARDIEHRLTTIKGIQKVEAKTLTGSVLVLFDPRAVMAPESLLHLSETLGDLFPGLDLANLAALLTSSVAGGATPSFTEFVGDSLAGLAGQMAAMAPGVDLKTLFPLACLVFGLPLLLRR